MKKYHKFLKGFYGEVFKGYLERPDRESQPVAVKKLKANALSTTRQDLEREIAIMEVIRLILHFVGSWMKFNSTLLL